MLSVIRVLRPIPNSFSLSSPSRCRKHRLGVHIQCLHRSHLQGFLFQSPLVTAFSCSLQARSMQVQKCIIQRRLRTFACTKCRTVESEYKMPEKLRGARSPQAQITNPKLIRKLRKEKLQALVQHSDYSAITILEPIHALVDSTSTWRQKYPTTPVLRTYHSRSRMIAHGALPPVPNHALMKQSFISPVISRHSRALILPHTSHLPLFCPFLLL